MDAGSAATLSPYRFGKKWGYVNSAGEVAIPFQFAAARDFSAFGLAPVKKEGKWGFIDAKGTQIVPCAFDEVADFSANGLAPAKLDRNWGYIDAKGATVVPFDLVRAEPFTANGLAPVSWMSKRYRDSVDSGYVNAKGQRFKFFYSSSLGPNGMICVENGEDEKRGFVDSHGELVVPFKYDAADAFTGGGLAKVNIGAAGIQKKGGKWGFVNARGEEVIPLIYDEAAYKAFDGGSNLACVKRDGKWGCVNNRGEEIVPLVYDELAYKAFRDGSTLARARKDGKWGCINEQGDVVVPVRYDDVTLSKDGKWLSLSKDGKWGVEDLQGRVIVPHAYEWLGEFKENGLTQFKRDGKFGCINRNLEEVVPPRFEKLGNFLDNGLAIAQLGNKSGCVNTRGETAVPFEYEEIRIFSANGFAPAKRGGKWGIVSERGEETAAFRYEAVYTWGFSANGLLPVKLQGKWGYVDEHGNEVIPCTYFEAEGFGRVNPFSKSFASGRQLERLWTRGIAPESEANDSLPPFDTSGLAKVSLSRFQSGYIDVKGAPVVPLRFNNLHEIDANGWAQFTYEHRKSKRSLAGFVHAGHGWMIMAKGGWVRDIDVFVSRGLIRVRKEGKYGYVDIRGEVKIPLRFDAATRFSGGGLAMVRENGRTCAIDATGAVVVLEETMDGRKILRNSRGETVWPAR